MIGLATPATEGLAGPGPPDECLLALDTEEIGV
jgi:hypothetical protein